MPSVVSLARFKISGKLPTLQLNFSDSKYKSILRLIDVTIPRFDNSEADTNAVVPSNYDLSSGLFYLPETEYNVDETDYEDADDGQPANDRSREVCIPSNFFDRCIYVVTRIRGWDSECSSFHSK